MFLNCTFHFEDGELAKLVILSTCVSIHSLICVITAGLIISHLSAKRNKIKKEIYICEKKKVSPFKRIEILVNKVEDLNSVETINKVTKIDPVTGQDCTSNASSLHSIPSQLENLTFLDIYSNYD